MIDPLIEAAVAGRMKRTDAAPFNRREAPDPARRRPPPRRVEVVSSSIPLNSVKSTEVCPIH
jgi:hypothetical protein